MRDDFPDLLSINQKGLVRVANSSRRDPEVGGARNHLVLNCRVPTLWFNRRDGFVLADHICQGDHLVAKVRA